MNTKTINRSTTRDGDTLVCKFPSKLGQYKDVTKKVCSVRIIDVVASQSFLNRHKDESFYITSRVYDLQDGQKRYLDRGDKDDKILQTFKVTDFIVFVHNKLFYDIFHSLVSIDGIEFSIVDHNNNAISPHGIKLVLEIENVHVDIASNSLYRKTNSISHPIANEVITKANLQEVTILHVVDLPNTRYFDCSLGYNRYACERKVLQKFLNWIAGNGIIPDILTIFFDKYDNNNVISVYDKVSHLKDTKLVFLIELQDNNTTQMAPLQR